MGTICGIITLTVSTVDTDHFDIYSDADSYATPFETDISRAALVSGFLSVNIPDTATTIRVVSNDVCTNSADAGIVVSVTPTPTPSITPTHTPQATPSITPTHTPQATPSITPTHTPSITPTPSVTPVTTTNIYITVANPISYNVSWVELNSVPIIGVVTPGNTGSASTTTTGTGTIEVRISASSEASDSMTCQGDAYFDCQDSPSPSTYFYNVPLNGSDVDIFVDEVGC